jgi:serine protease Do
MNRSLLRSALAVPLITAALLLFARATAAQLPDFTALVEQNTPVVVNVTSIRSIGDGNQPESLDDELLRRIFPVPPDHPQFRQPPERTSGGSGFVIASDGYILTNHHVVDSATEVRVRLHDRREFDAKVVGSDPLSDVALLKIEASGLTAARLGQSGRLKPGQWVVAIGSPFSLDFTVTAGIVSAVGRSMPDNNQRYVPFIQTDVAINRGNSGGPLFNLAGEVVGINSQIFSTTGGSIGLSFAIPIETARSVADQLRTKGRVSRGVIGVQIQRIARDEAEALGLDRIRGALVGQVQDGSAAQKAGVKVGDVIVAFNGVAIEDSAELPPLVGATTPGTRAMVSILRDGRTLELPVVVAELDESAQTLGSSATPGPATRGALGIVVRDLTAEEREEVGLESEGVLVERVDGVAARRAGLRAGDLILMVGRQRVGTSAEFRERAAAVPAGQAVMLLIRRGDTTSFVAVRPRAED